MRLSRVILFATLTFAAGLGIVEIFARLAVPSFWYGARKPSEDALLVPHAVRGYALRADLTHSWKQTDFEFDVQLNERGLRDVPLPTARAARLRILACGDSYTFGIGVESEQSWPEQLERLLADDVTAPGRAAVVNCGIPGYSARQIRRTVEEHLPELAARIVVVGMYANSYWRVENPYVIHGGTLVRRDRVGAIELSPRGDLILTAFAPGALRSLDIWLKQHLHAGAHLLSLVNGGRHWPEQLWPERSPEAIARDYQPALDEIGATQRFAQSHGAELLVLVINQQQEDGSFDEVEHAYNETLRAYCAREGIHLVDPLQELIRRAEGKPLFRFESDNHWSPAAHAVAAELLHRYVVAKGLVDGATPQQR